jgi:polygalacturonase
MKPPARFAFLVISLVAGSLLPMRAEVDVAALEHLCPARPVIPDRTFRLTDFGAVGDGHTLNTAAFSQAVAAVEHAGGGHLIVPAGVFCTGPFRLCSSLDLQLEAGAVVQAPDNFAALGLPDPATLHSAAEVRRSVPELAPLIFGQDLHDVAITGPGVIDGSGAHWWAWSERAARKLQQPGRVVYPRPHLIAIDGCQRLLVADVTLRNSSKFHLVPSRITDLTIERVKVRAPFDAPNTDAIDPGTVTNAVIRGCDIDTGDDDIVIKSGGRNILIEDCTIRHGHGLSIGSGTSLGVSDMLVRNCTLDGTDNGIRIKSMRGGGGPVGNIRYTGIHMRGVPHAVILDLNYVDNNRPDFRGDPRKIPSIRGILIDHVTIEGSEHAGRIVGLPDSRITDVTLRDVTVTAEHDFVIKHAEAPTLERVTRTIRPGVAPARESYVE